MATSARRRMGDAAFPRQATSPWPGESAQVVLRAALMVFVALATCQSHGVADDFAYEKLIVAGDPDGSPADSPANRVDPNVTTSVLGGVGSLRLVLPGDGTYICTGTPITDRVVLTAAHCLDLDDDGAVDLTPGNVTFQLNYDGTGSDLLSASALAIHPDFTGFASPAVNDDLGLITLSSPLPANVPVYPLYRPSVTTGTTFTLVGYGRSGTGVDGFTVDPSYSVKRSGQNNADRFRADDEGTGVSEVFEFDFDGPTGNGQLGGPSLGNDVETTIGGGDSGGPSFVTDGGTLKLAGVNTYSFRFGPPFGPQNPNPPFFRSGGGGILVAPYLSWVDAQIGPDKFWDDPAGGMFDDDANWVGGAPSNAFDTARFDLSADYTVSFTATVAHQLTTVGNDRVTLDLNGFTYSPAALVIGEAAGDVAELALTGGTVSTSSAMVGSGGTATLTLADDAALTTTGMVDVAAGSTLAGGGTINGVVDSNGIVAPGAPLGTLSVIGDYSQQAAATLQLDIDGASPGAFDALDASGTASLDGTLDIDLGFVPQFGDSFPVLSAGARSGGFSEVLGATYTSGLLNSVLGIVYAPTGVTLLASLSGDANGDGVVNITDTLEIAANFGASGASFTDGDVNLDGVVDITDSLEVAANFGAMIPALAVIHPVPEPSTWTAALLGLLGWVATRRTRPSRK